MLNADSLDRGGTRETKSCQVSEQARRGARELRSKGERGLCLATRAAHSSPTQTGFARLAFTEHLCASGVVIYQPLKTLYKLLSEITQVGWLWCTAPRPVQWAPSQDAPEQPGGLLLEVRAGQQPPEPRPPQPRFLTAALLPELPGGLGPGQLRVSLPRCCWRCRLHSSLSWGLLVHCKMLAASLDSMTRR